MPNQNLQRYMLVDLSGEIPTEGPAYLIESYQEPEPGDEHMVCVEILPEFRKSGDTDGIRECSRTHLVPIESYTDPCPVRHDSMLRAVHRPDFGYCCARCNRVVRS